ncbi:Peroxiredoxin 5 [Nesidiocoris tenuis]|uniref:Peroxiredoxin-5 n=1 Tax=Nesidiocoris tenuis TaxID=355587 RepID=A0ABN7ARF3_9HEMI|nr:Peroxiredoxin 5 [Nesidiocoris tenuis]
MSLEVGDKIPNVDLFENSPMEVVNSEELCSGKTIVLVGAPGAFTPDCTLKHLPGYVEDADDLKARGVDEIVCVAVNDPFVMAAWGQTLGASGKVRMLADPMAAFAKAVDLAADVPLFGTRSKRYSMVIRDGVVSELNVEPDPSAVTISASNNLKLE